MKTDPEIAIAVDDIHKSFGEVEALKGVSFEASRGELFGLIGPDGAGKSTLFRILTSLLIPDEGSARVIGLDTVRDYRKLRRRIGYMPGDFSLYRDLSVEENLKFFASIFNTTIEKNYHLVKDIYVQLEPFRKRRADKLSGGMKQKLALCCALIHEPEVLFLDEPTTGVDAVSRDEFWEMLARLVERGITIVVSTPYMDEASRCQRVALIQKGEILRIDTPESISNSYRGPLYAVRSANMYRLPSDLRTMSVCISAERFGESVHVKTTQQADPKSIKHELISLGHSNIDIRLIPATVEDVFLELIRS